MSKKIRVIIKEPGRNPRCVNISDSLENLQKTVGGYIETVTLCADLVIICNEEGRLLGLPYCCDVAGISLVGTVVFAGINEDSFSDIPCEYKDFKRLFPALWPEHIETESNGEANERK